MIAINNIPYLSVKDLSPWFSQSFLDKQTSLGKYPFIYKFDPDQPNRKTVKLIPYTGIPENTRLKKSMPTVSELLAKIYRSHKLIKETGEKRLFSAPSVKTGATRKSNATKIALTSLRKLVAQIIS